MSSNNNFKETFLTKKGEDIIIGEDSTDYLTVNSETRFLNDVNIGGSSIKLRSTDDTNANNFIEIMGKKLHSTHAQTLREIRTITEDEDNQNKILKIGSEGAIVAGDAGGGGSGIVNNRIDGDLTIGEDDSELLTIASKLHIPGGESGQVLTKGTDGSIEYGPTAFPSVSLPTGVVKEYICEVPTGQTITLAKGNNITLDNVTGVQISMTDSYVLLTGSTIGYVPPDGTNYIIYEFDFQIGRLINNSASLTYFKLQIDGTDVPDSNSTKNAQYGEERHVLSYRVDATNWGAVPKVLRIMLKRQNSDHTPQIHKTTYPDTGTDYFSAPLVSVKAIGAPATFTTANPLLANPSTADKGKIITVNSAGDDLEYGANFRELACKQTIITNPIVIDEDSLDHDQWLDLASHITTPNDDINTLMNTETTVNVPQNSKVEVKAEITFSTPAALTDYCASIRLGKKVNGIIIWGSITGKVVETDPNDIALSDPKGSADGTNRIRAWATTDEYRHASNVGWLTTRISASYIDEDPTNGLSGNHNVTYFLRLLNHFPYDLTIGRTGQAGNSNSSVVPTMLSAVEIGSGAITSFTQEQALAGAGGTAAFTNAVSGIDGNYGSKDNLVDDKLYSDSSNSSLYTDQLCSLLKGGNTYWFYSVTFTTPQIVTKYRIWGRGDGSNTTSNQNPRNWEFRAATDSSTYNATDSTTYTVLDSQVSATFNSYTSTANASDNLGLGNVYNLSTIGAYKHYVLHITANGNNAGTGYHSTHCTMSEIALYGGGFTIPSQIGHSGKTLKTNGTALEWSTPVTGLLPPPVPENKGKIVTVNASGDDLEYGATYTENTTRIHKICNMLASTNTLTTAWPSIVPTDGDLTIKKNETAIFFVNMSGYTTSGGEGTWTFKYSTNNGSTYTAFTDPPNGEFKHFFNSSSDHQHRTGTLKFTTSSDIIINSFQVDCSGYANANDYVGMYALITSGNAITSFTQEQALAGAGGTASFTARAMNGTSFVDFPSNYYENSTNALSQIHDNIVDYHSFALKLGENLGSVPVIVSYEFQNPQIVTKYRLWSRASGGDRRDEMAGDWELRAAVSKSDYENGTYVTLDSISGIVTTDWIQPSYNSSGPSEYANDNFNIGKEYNLSTIGAYKYYVLYITSNCGDSTYLGIGEWALYGGGFTIPSQVGNTGRLLTTDGTSLGWSTTAALPSVTVPEPTSTNKGRALVSTGDGIEFSDFNSGVSTGFKVYKSGTAFEEVTTNTAVLFDQTTTNVGAGHYDKVTGVYTIPVTGYYNIFANFTLPSVIWCAYSTTISSNKFTNYTDGTDMEQIITSPGKININQDFNETTGIFTCSIPGVYNISVAVMGPATRQTIKLYKNNSDLMEIVDSGTDIWPQVDRSIIIELDINDTLYLYNAANANTEVQFSGELIQSGIDYRIQKSTNSGNSYTELTTCSDKPSTNIVESLNQNDLIRVISGDGSTGSTLNFQQGSTKNSFGAHLLNSGNSTSPIPIYGFFVEKSNNGGSSVITTSGTDTTISGWNIDGTNHFILPSSNFDLTNGIYTIPLSGYYQVTATIRTTRGDGSRINISVNNENTGGSLHIQTYQVTDQQDAWSLNGILKLNTNDTIRIKIQASDFQYSADDTHWSCFLLASDTQTNTRQMGLSSIVPLHQLGHDQFAEGVFSIMEYSSSTDTGNIDNRSVDGDKLSAITSSNITSYKLSDSSISTVKYNLGSTDYTTVPGSPHTNWTDSTDYIQIALFVDFQIDSLNNFFTTGSFTIDLSKILTNFVGLWNVGIQWDEDLRININNEMFYFDSHSGGTTHYKNININNRYINCTFNHQESSGGERVNLYFYRICSIPQQAIAEPVMPSITLPTPNSNNNGKVLVSNGSGYALQPHSGYVPVYGFFVEISGDTTSTANGTIGNWNKNGSNHFTLPSNNYNLTTGVYTIPVSGYYQVNATIRVNNNAGNRVYVSVNNNTTNGGANITLSNYQDTNDKEAWSLNGVLKLNINDTIELKVQHSGLQIDNDDTHWSCMLLNTTEVNATPSINIPLPVAAHAGKSLTVNSAGTGLEYSDSGAILQVQHARATGRQEITGNTATDITDTDAYITGLSITFTPKKSSSKILITAMINAAANYVTTFGFLKDGSALATPTPTNTFSSGSILTINPERNNNAYMDNIYIEWLDNATNTNNRTYKAAVCDHGNRTIYINNRHNSDFASFSSMTIYEIAQ